MSLAERSRRSGIGRPQPPATQTTNEDGAGQRPTGPTGPTVRHCWVVDAPMCPGRWPGVLQQWRRTSTGWQGQAVWVATDIDGPILLQAWLDAGHLHPTS